MPTEQAKLLELAERCEAAEGPDRKLDEAIERATGNYNAFAHYTLGDDDFDEYVPTRYTASIDAAMTLVLDDWVIWQMGDYPDNSPHRWHCTLWQDGSDTPGDCVYATKLALALTAASLRARATENIDATGT